MSRKMTVHYYEPSKTINGQYMPTRWGCPYASGEKQCADTDARNNWREVTCGLCLQRSSLPAHRNHNC